MDGFLSPYAGIIRTIKIIFGYIWNQFSQWYQLADQNDVMPSIWWFMFTSILIWVFLTSGFVAATIAESRGRSPMPYFFLGLLLPGLYPALINNSMHNLEQEQIKEELVEEKEKQHDQSIELTARLMNVAGQEYTPSELKLNENGEEIVEEAVVVEEDYPFNRLYFNSVATRPDGNPAGPFFVTLNDGRTAEADCILEILDDVVIFQINGSSGTPRKLRLGYKLITGCELRSA